MNVKDFSMSQAHAKGILVQCKRCCYKEVKYGLG